MEIKLNLLEEFDVYELFRILNNEINRLEKDNCQHKDMISLLEGNETNERAKNNLRHARDCIEKNNREIKIFNNIREQLRPLVEEAISPKP